MSASKWLDGLKVGSEVVVHDGWGKVSIETVTKLVGRERAVEVGLRKFSRINGTYRGGHAGGDARIEKPTAKLRAVARRHQLVEFITGNPKLLREADGIGLVTLDGIAKQMRVARDREKKKAAK